MISSFVQGFTDVLVNIVMKLHKRAYVDHLNIFTKFNWKYVIVGYINHFMITVQLFVFWWAFHICHGVVICWSN